jgi:hypothetical protein
LALLVGLACSGCGTHDEDIDNNRGNPDGGAATDDGSRGTCPVEAKPGAPFAFHVHNRLPGEIALGFGCGGDTPIEINTLNGTLRGGIESVDFCGNECQPVLDGKQPRSCTDCGPGITNVVAPGETFTFSWDRRVWVKGNIPPKCSGLPKDEFCGLGTALPLAVVHGMLLFCEGSSSFCSNKAGYAFDADLSRDSVDISPVQ